ncbi:MAG: hypothetical protein VX180_07510 [Pseudomonadota bacterium]|nr:hypothetical protein [Halieaceae bacterium]MEC7095416.1 hypothetical protein [Pseudomonadota bacterium]MAP04422.1 hypothetical protein [Halieaceae bacterium]MEC7491812.1 hypothetical protein [Pseudomonadota bacterium]MEC7993829.1 hypothetical protein [Pseudomonadota bacterium]
MAKAKALMALFKLYVILVEVTRSQWVKFGARKNPEAGPYFGYVLLGTLVIALVVFALKE